MTITFKTLEKKKTKLYANFYGIPACGKTYSALLVATKLANSNEKVLIIDTEGRSHIYGNDFPGVKIYDLTLNITTSQVIEIIKEAKKQEFEAIVIDSLTPLWDKLVGEADKGADKRHGANWKSAKTLISSFTQALSTCGMHIITTSLAQDVLDKEMKPTGEIKPCFERKRFEPYLSLQLMIKNKGTIAKIDKSLHHDLEDVIKIDKKISADSVLEIKKWIGDGGDNSENDIFNLKIDQIKYAEKIDAIFEEIKELSKEEQRKVYASKDNYTKEIWKENLSILSERIEEYKILTQQYDQIKDTSEYFQDFIADKA